MKQPIFFHFILKGRDFTRFQSNNWNHWENAFHPRYVTFRRRKNLHISLTSSLPHHNNKWSTWNNFSSSYSEIEVYMPVSFHEHYSHNLTICNLPRTLHKNYNYNSTICNLPESFWVNVGHVFFTNKYFDIKP